MAQAEVGALRVRLSLDAGEFTRGLKSSETALDKFAANAKRAALVAAGAIAGVAGGVVASVKSMLDQADKLGKMAQSIGIPVEELSKLKHAADLSGVSLESLGKGVGRLSRNLVEAAQGSQAPIRAFETLGIQIRNVDGSLKTVSQVLPEIAAKFANMRDGPEKTALAMQVLGRAGAELIPLLNGGAQGLRDMMKEAEDLGIVIDKKTAKAAENFNDNLTRLGRVKDGIITKITAELAPALSLLSQRFIDAAKDSDMAKVAAKAILYVVEFLAREVAIVAIRVEELAAKWSALWAALSATNWEDMKKGFAGFGAASDQARGRLELLGLQLENFKRVAEFEAQLAANMANTGGGAPAIVDKITGVKEATRLAADEARRWKDENLAGMDAIINAPTETYVAKIAAVNAAMEQGILTQQRWGKLTRDINKENQGHMLDTASATASALTSIFKDNKAAAIAAAIINTAVAVTKSLSTVPLPWGAALAALNVATGAAQIAAIKSTSQSGGGSAPAAPSSSAASESAAASAPSGGTLTVQGIDPSSFFSGESVRTLAGKLLQFQRDGGTVVLA